MFLARLVRCEDAVGNGGGFYAGADVVNAEDVGSAEDGGDVSGIRGVETIVRGGWFALEHGRERGSVGEGIGEEALAGGSDEDRGA